MSADKLTNPSVEMREFALKLADFDLSRALLLKGADEIEQARRTGAFWKAEKIASESEITRLRAALTWLRSWRKKDPESIDHAIEQALSGEPPSPAEPTAKLAYHETHEPPHCPTCSCGTEKSGEKPAGADSLDPDKCPKCGEILVAGCHVDNDPPPLL